jgi:acyl-CoA thioesterase FadM
MHKFRLMRLFFLFLLDTRSRDPLRPVVCRFLVTPLDVEVSRAVSHAYLAFAGLGRWYYLFHNVNWRGLLREKWAPLTHSEMIQYRQAAKLFSVVVVTTSVIWWDEKMFYFEHRFTQGETVLAISFSRGAFFRGRERVAQGCIKHLPAVPLTVRPRVVDFWNSGADHFQPGE